MLKIKYNLKFEIERLKKNVNCLQIIDTWANEIWFSNLALMVNDITPIVFQNFQRQSNLLFTVLSSVRSHNASPHLAQLLLRLDYNHYFSVAGGQLGR